MQTERNMHPDINDWKIEVRHNASNKVLVTLDTVWGPSIKD